MNVLIVDDSTAIRKILMRVVQQAGAPITKFLEAGDGSEALEVLRRGEQVDLMFVDTNMPKMNGLGLVTHLKQDPRCAQWKDTPIPMVTTEGGEQCLAEAIRLGISGYVRKPFTADQVKEKMVALGFII
jgi:two-component system chemotaxis response regulator CheY